MWIILCTETQRRRKKKENHKKTNNVWANYWSADCNAVLSNQPNFRVKQTCENSDVKNAIQPKAKAKAKAKTIYAKPSP